MKTKKNASDNKAAPTKPAPHSETSEEIEAKVRYSVRAELNRALPDPGNEEDYPRYQYEKIIPPGLEDQMVTYDVETYGMSPHQIVDHFNLKPFDQFLELIPTDSKFKVSARDLHGALESTLDFNLWFHLTKTTHKLKKDEDYICDDRFTFGNGIFFTLDSAIWIAVKSDSILGACVSDEVFGRRPVPYIMLREGYFIESPVPPTALASMPATPSNPK